MDENLFVINHYGCQLAERFIGQLEQEGQFLTDTNGKEMIRFRLSLSEQFQGSWPKILRQTEKVAQNVLLDILAAEKELAIFEYVLSSHPGQLNRRMGRMATDKEGALALVINQQDLIYPKNSVLLWKLRKLKSTSFVRAIVQGKTYQDFPEFNVKKLENPVVLLALKSQTLYYFYDDRGLEVHFSNPEMAERIATKYQSYKTVYEQLLAKYSK